MKHRIPAAVVVIISVVALTFRVVPMYANIINLTNNSSRRCIVGIQFKWLWLKLFETSYQAENLNHYWLPVVAAGVVKALLVILIIFQVWRPIRYIIKRHNEALTGE